MSGGILDALNDPEVMARIAERQHIIDRVAERMGVSRKRAIEALDDFTTNFCHEGLTVH